MADLAPSTTVVDAACGAGLTLGAADAVLCFNALHCVADPQAVVGELARWLAPGGLALGTSLVRSGSSRADRLLRLDPTMGPGGTLADLEASLGKTPG